MPRKEASGADSKFLHGSPEELANRAKRGEAGPATESHFSQIRPSTSSGRSGITGRQPGRARNATFGKSLKHSAD